MANIRNSNKAGKEPINEKDLIAETTAMDGRNRPEEVSEKTLEAGEDKLENNLAVKYQMAKALTDKGLTIRSIERILNIQMIKNRKR